jgi:subtilisin family serine protease
MLHIDQAHDIATGKGVKVAIIDTGADLTHPLLKRSIVGGWDFVDNDVDPSDKLTSSTTGALRTTINGAYGHGTHVAGIVHLVAPNAQLLIVRVLDANGNGDFVNVAAGVRWAVENGAKVINLSLGAGVKGVDVLEAALVDARNAGVIVVTAAGNQASLAVDFPGRSDLTICTAAVDANGAGATFSSFNHSDVALSAPGVAIRSTYPGGRYRLWSGTSMSAPFVTGAAALLAEVHPAWGEAEMLLRLKGTTDPIAAPAPNGADITPGRDFGAGALDVGAALAPDFVPGPNQNPDPEDIRPH